MSTPLIILAVILAVFAFVLIPLMFVKGGQKQQHVHDKQGNKQHKKRKKK